MNLTKDQKKFQESKIIFVSDFFRNDYAGGAELTTDALFKTAPYDVFQLKTSDLNKNILSAGVQKTWVFFNFSHLNHDLIPLVIQNCNYFIVEYDYKFCRFRSVELHKVKTGNDCDCHLNHHGKVISAFFAGAEHIFWMSERQKNLYSDYFSFLKDYEKSTILTSVFDIEDLEFIERLRITRKEFEVKNEYVLINSNSWIKGIEKTKEYLKEEDISYEIVGGLAYHDLLRKLSEYSGLAFMPLGGDTCPRTVIEAKLLGLDLLINENVQHAEEDWWQLDIDGIEAYILEGHNRFWDKITGYVNRTIKVSGYTQAYNVMNSDYPWRESITSLLGFCHEVVVLDGGSNDGTYKALLEWAEEEERLVIRQLKRDWNDPRFALFNGQQKAAARTLCTGEWCWQVDIDEVVHENDYDKIQKMLRQIPKPVKIISLPVIEYWGSDEKVRLDVNPWKWRLSKNDPHITHDVNANHRRYDENGNLFSIGSDGDDYVHTDTYQAIPDMNFYTPELHQVRTAALEGNKDALNAYSHFMNLVVEQLPGVHHYSWYDLKRKVYTYKNFWSKHWASLYNKTIEDVPENNMFFDKCWKDVSDEEIEEISLRMKNELGGWVFHSRIDFDKPTPWAKINKTQPKIMKNWIKKRNKE